MEDYQQWLKQAKRQKRVDETFEYIFNVGIGLLIACFFYWWLK